MMLSYWMMEFYLMRILTTWEEEDRWSNRKILKESNRQFTKKKVQIASKHIKMSPPN